MPYTKQTWSDGASGGTPLSAARLQYMEDGIDAIDADVVAEAAARATADGLLLPKAGGTLTGALVLSGDAAGALEATPLQQVQALVAALVDAAPGTLDTLNELAAALADDPNFATTITNALADKQPLDSDLTAIAALSTTSYGRSFLDLADAAAGLSLLGAVATDDARFTTVTHNTQTASYTLVLGDAGKLVEMNVGTANILTVPPNSSVAFPIGTVVGWRQYGAGQVTLTPGSGVTIRSSGGKLKTAAQYAEGSLTKRAADEWVASGDLAA